MGLPTQLPFAQEAPSPFTQSIVIFFDVSLYLYLSQMKCQHIILGHKPISENVAWFQGKVSLT
jgi:hypothetical protein